jgi:putative addiction module component (TIGR02574 family)
MASSEEIFRDAVALPTDVRAELAERLIASLAEDISPEISVAQLAEVRRRIAQVESGDAVLIPGDEVWARVRNLLAEHLSSNQRDTSPTEKTVRQDYHDLQDQKK